MAKKPKSPEPDSSTDSIDRGETEEILDKVRELFAGEYREYVLQPGYLKEGEGSVFERCAEALVRVAHEMIGPHGVLAIAADRRRELLRQIIAGVPDEELQEFVADVLKLQAGRQAASVTADEGTLIAAISSAVPTDVQRRYGQLVKKRAAEKLTRKEHDELLELTEIVEGHQATRLEALAELAALRGVPLATLMTEMQLGEPCDE